MIPIFSPEPHTRPVNLIEEKLGLVGAVSIVPFEKVPDAEERFCSQNVRAVVAARGGGIVYGWLVWQHGHIFVQAEHHSVWSKPTGELVCITPQTPPVEAITFIPDSSATYDFDADVLTPNVRVALISDSRLQQFFRACDEQTEIMNATQRLSKNSRFAEISVADAMRLYEVENRKTALLNGIVLSQRVKAGRNDLCPCGSR